jgi:hypothetical protein
MYNSVQWYSPPETPLAYQNTIPTPMLMKDRVMLQSDGSCNDIHVMYRFE